MAAEGSEFTGDLYEKNGSFYRFLSSEEVDTYHKKMSSLYHELVSLRNAAPSSIFRAKLLPAQQKQLRWITRLKSVGFLNCSSICRVLGAFTEGSDEPYMFMNVVYIPYSWNDCSTAVLELASLGPVVNDAQYHVGIQKHYNCEPYGSMPCPRKSSIQMHEAAVDIIRQEGHRPKYLCCDPLKKMREILETHYKICPSKKINPTEFCNNHKNPLLQLSPAASAAAKAAASAAAKAAADAKAAVILSGWNEYAAAVGYPSFVLDLENRCYFQTRAPEPSNASAKRADVPDPFAFKRTLRF